MKPRPRPCLVCGVRVEGGKSRCARHLVGSGRPRPCLVCGRPSQGNFCAAHLPEIDEAERNARNPYRQAYKSQEYAHARQHRFERAHGRCESCGIHLLPGDWECHHVIAIKNGGTNDITNLRILCRPCHKIITAQERRAG